jgi:beta-galactosidase
MRNLSIEKGIFYLEGKPLFLLSADYPYYRDHASYWEDRLKKLKEANINIITAYIPWRHHTHKGIKGKVIYDFEGKTQDNRNLYKFIEISQKFGHYLILKPGPFIHAEVNFGGLPDWVSPEEDESIHPMLDFQERPLMWSGKVLPSPLDEKFLKLACEWLSKVDKEIFSQILYPKGNLIGIQIANEGIYSNAAFNISAFDYSLPALKLYKKFLRQKYPYLKDTTPPKNITGIKTKEEVFKLMAWSGFQGFYYREVLENWKEAINTKVPFVVNLSPPHIDDIDSWLSRNVLEEFELKNIHYGYTDWIGLAQEDKAVRNVYLTITRRATGFNLEDNWGFSKIYDERYKYPDTSFYQSLFTIACGAKGFNVYTGTSTAHWDLHLDNQHEIPYPATAPISEKGNTTEKYQTLKLICAFFKDHAKDFLESALYTPFTWGLYLPYAHLCAWFKKREDFQEAELQELNCANAFLKFVSNLYENNLDCDVLNLTFAEQKVLNSKKVIVLEGGFFMDKKTQAKLSTYVKQGGLLVISKELPKLNERFEDCHILMECFHSQGKGKIILVPQDKDLTKTLINETKPESKLFSKYKDLRIFLYEHPHSDIQFIFVFNESNQDRFVEFEVKNKKKIGLNMTKKAASLIKIENGALKALLIKSKSELYNSKITPKFTLNGEVFKLEEPTDFYAVKKGPNWQIQKF